MLRSGKTSLLKRKDDRILCHFDYDCFYASVFEAENPVYKSLPLAVQQKHIIVTCNYEARRRGLYKLQLITEAKRLCPDAVIVLGEDLTRFRNASKTLYEYLRAFTWSDKAEKLGFDEVWLDITDIVNYNIEILNRNDLVNCFFQLSRTDPTLGFSFDASTYAGSVFPVGADLSPLSLSLADQNLRLRLILGSHLAFHMRLQLEEHHGYTSTVGISTNKLISKLVGNLNKPKGQTTLVPPYESNDNNESNVTMFLDTLDIGKVPGIGFKLAQKIREYVLNRPAEFDAGLVYGGTKENVTVGHVRQSPEMSAELLDRILAGPGTPHGIGVKVLGLLNGVDNTEVSEARNVPRQISIEDSYLRLDTMKELTEQLQSLSARLIDRMRIDLTETLDEPAKNGDKWKWLAHPPTLRLTTRPRLPLNEDGSRQRSFKRMSRSAPTPSFIFSQSDTVDAVADRLVKESLLPLFRKLHPEKSGWNLSLVNVAVTGMEDEGKGGASRHIGSMFKPAETGDASLNGSAQLDVTSPSSVNPSTLGSKETHSGAMDLGAIQNSDSTRQSLQESSENTQAELDAWDDPEDDIGGDDDRCTLCGVAIPEFARAAHERFHNT